jgi:hypothetical protein
LAEKLSELFINTMSTEITLKSLARRIGGVKMALREYMDVDRWTFDYPYLEKGAEGRLDDLCALLLQRSGYTVYSGPFAGMKLFSGSDISRKPPQIVGSYECELHDVIYKVAVAGPGKIINIGSAYGYYAVGLARILPRVQIISYEMVQDLHWEQARRLSELNEVSARILQAGRCGVDELRAVCESGSFVFCDCEGGEEILLDPEEVPALESCGIVCELHDFIVPGVIGRLVERFRGTHHITVRDEQGRNPESYQILRGLRPRLQSLALFEAREIPGRLTTGRYMIMWPRIKSDLLW